MTASKPRGCHGDEKRANNQFHVNLSSEADSSVEAAAVAEKKITSISQAVAVLNRRSGKLTRLFYLVQT